MTTYEEMVDIIKCVAIFNNTSTDWQKARYLEVIQKDAQRIIKVLATPDVSKAKRAVKRSANATAYNDGYCRGYEDALSDTSKSV